MAGPKPKSQPVNRQIEEAVHPLIDQITKLTSQNDELLATNERLQETLAGELLKFEERISLSEGLLGDPDAGAKDVYLRKIVGHLLSLLKVQRVELPAAKLELADVALKSGAALIAEATHIRDADKKEKLEAMKNG